MRVVMPVIDWIKVSAEFKAENVAKFLRVEQ